MQLSAHYLHLTYGWGYATSIRSPMTPQKSQRPMVEVVLTRQREVA